MGIRSVEKSLAAELCYQAVAEAVDNYLAESREAGYLLSPYETLVIPIVRAGCHPVGLAGAGDFIFEHRLQARAAARDAGRDGQDVSVVDADPLIEWIMWPYPTARLRREATRLLVARQARESRGQDTTKCNTLQHNEAASDPATKASGARPEKPVPPAAVARHLEEMEKRTHYESLRDNQFRLTIDPPPRERSRQGAR